MKGNELFNLGKYFFQSYRKKQSEIFRAFKTKKVSEKKTKN